jgi:hypothetical protein
MKRDHRGFVALENDEMQSVVESELRNAPLEFLKILRYRQRGEEQQNKA